MVDQKRGAVHKLVRHGAYKFWDWLAGQLIACSIMIFLFSLGIGYIQDDERIEEATVVAAKQAGQKEIANGYHQLWKQVDDAKKSCLERFPEEWHEPLKKWSLPAAGAILAAGVLVLLWRAPSRAHALREVGWGIWCPGLLGALATIVLEWRAMKAIKATFAGDRTASTLWTEGSGAGVEAGTILWPVLAGGVVLLLLGWRLEKRWEKQKGKSKLVLKHVFAHFLMIAGAVPWFHFLAAIVMGALSEGSSTGASVAPYTTNRGVYLACTALFAFGAALWFLARSEAKRLEKEGLAT
jgi:hypothetical protein